MVVTSNCTVFLRRVFTKGKDNTSSRKAATARRKAAGPTGRAAPRQQGRSPSTAHAAEERFWRRKPPPPTDMPRELWLNIQSTRPAHTWGEAGATQSLRKAFFCSFQPSCVHDRKSPPDCSVSFPCTSLILAPLIHARDRFSRKGQENLCVCLGYRWPATRCHLHAHTHILFTLNIVLML